MLEQSERDFPDDYNAPSRLALAYRQMKKYDEALAASDRALKLVYGPRKLYVLRARADIYEAKGDKEAAKKTISEAAADGAPERGKERGAGEAAGQDVNSKPSGAARPGGRPCRPRCPRRRSR